MVNRYDNPAQAQFINTYVPIPFEQLYTLGKEAKADVDKAMTNLSTTFDKWSDFRSPSAVDTKIWYDETMGKARPLVDELASNLDLIKTPEGRAKINSMINNVDRAKLSMLKQSAKSLEERQKVNQKLMVEGKYNPLWHDVDFTNYNTAKAGIFNDVAPLAYQDIRSLSNPYYKELEPSYLGTKNGYDIMGITRGDIEDIATAQFNNIASTPEAAKHMEVYMQRTGASAEEAQKWFRDQIVQSNLDRVREIQKPNEYAMADYKASLAMRAARQKQADKQGEPDPDVYSQVYTSDNEALMDKLGSSPYFSSVTQLAQVRSNLEANIVNEINTVLRPELESGKINKAQYEKQLKGYQAQLADLDLNKAMQESARLSFTDASGIVPSVGVAKDKIAMYPEAASRVLDELTVPTVGVLSNVYNKNKANTEVEISNNNVTTKGYVMPNSQGAILSTEYVNKIMGVAPKEVRPMLQDNRGMLRNFAEELKRGRFKGVIKIPQFSHSTLSVGDDTQGAIAQRVEIKIPLSSFISAGYSKSEVNDMYKKYFGRKPEEDLNVKTPKDKDTQRTLNDTYYTFDVMEIIPNQGTDRMMLDQMVNKEYGGSKMQNDEYPSNIDQSYESVVGAMINALN